MPVLLPVFLLVGTSPTFMGCGSTEGAATSLPAPAAKSPAWACPLGPVVGSPVLQPGVAAGRYEAELDYSQDALPTMERTFNHDIKGHAWLELGAEGAFEACIGVKENRRSSVSKYASQDREYHSSEDESHSLLHIRGEWSALYDGARLVVSHLAWNECEAAAEAMTPFGMAQLVCGTLPAAPPLPLSALACRSLGQLPSLESAGLELGTGRRAGAWGLRQSPMDRGEPDPIAPCGPWLLLGTSPGFTIRSEEGRRDERPTVGFTAGVSPMVLKSYTNAVPD